MTDVLQKNPVADSFYLGSVDKQVVGRLVTEENHLDPEQVGALQDASSRRTEL